VLPVFTTSVSAIAPRVYATDDPRTASIAQLAERPCHDDARLTINWYFGHPHQQVVANDDTVTGLAVASSQGSRLINADSIITAIGFQSGKGQQLVDVDAQADATGRIEPGLYVAGWLRRGPVGTIP